MQESEYPGDVDPHDGRNETENERRDRNWSDVLQELRVTQTGTQILTGFLLALAFQSKFSELDRFQTVVYLCLVVLATLSTVLGLAPVALHRILFHQGRKGSVVRFGSRVLRATLIDISLLIVGVVFFIFDIVVGVEAAVIIASIIAVGIVALWLVLPLSLRRATH